VEVSAGVRLKHVVNIEPLPPALRIGEAGERRLIRRTVGQVDIRKLDVNAACRNVEADHITGTASGRRRPPRVAPRSATAQYQHGVGVHVQIGVVDPDVEVLDAIAEGGIAVLRGNLAPPARSSSRPQPPPTCFRRTLSCSAVIAGSLLHNQLIGFCWW
jgi:hypothetical protein